MIKERIAQSIESKEMRQGPNNIAHCVAIYLQNQISIEVKEVWDGIRPWNIAVAFGQNLLKLQ